MERQVLVLVQVPGGETLRILQIVFVPRTNRVVRYNRISRTVQVAVFFLCTGRKSTCTTVLFQMWVGTSTGIRDSTLQAKGYIRHRQWCTEIAKYFFVKAFDDELMIR